MKPTNEALRDWAKRFEGALLRFSGDGSRASQAALSVAPNGVVQLTERRAFVEAVIEIPLSEDGSIA